VEKLALNERHRVREHWIVHPEDTTLMVFTFTVSGSYGRTAVYSREDMVKAGLFPGEILFFLIESGYNELTRPVVENVTKCQHPVHRSMEMVTIRALTFLFHA